MQLILLPISLNSLLASGQCLLKFPLLPHETFKDMSWESYQKPPQTSAWASAEAERKRRLDLS